ncbi:hypothetical protein P9112_014415 [Eukaryota sp. TZLM1-RC]
MNNIPSNDDFMEYVMLRSNDGEEFVVPKHIAEMSGLIKRMLSSGTFKEASSVVRVPSTPVLNAKTFMS